MNNKTEKAYALEKFKKAVSRLKEGLAGVKDDLGKDGVIQRFEFTFEITWKTLKIFLKEKGVDVKTPKDALKEAFRVGWITDEAVFNLMLEDRNQTSHIYSEDMVNKIFTRIKDNFIGPLGALSARLETV